MTKLFRVSTLLALLSAPAAASAADPCSTTENGWKRACGAISQTMTVDIPFTKSVDLLSLEYSKTQFSLTTMVTLDAYRDFYTDVPPKAVSYQDRVFVSDRAFGADVKFVEAHAGNHPVTFRKCLEQSLHEVYCLNSQDSETLREALVGGQSLTIKWAAAGSAMGVAVFRGQGFREAASDL